MLGKRPSFDTIVNEGHHDRGLFFRHHLPELNEESGRMKYFKAYEFSKKQSNLLQYWRRAVNLYLKHFHKGFATHWSDLNDFFDQKGSKPLGLAKIILELSENKEVCILKDETEIKKVARYIGSSAINEESSGSFWKGVMSFFKRNNEEVMHENTIIVHINYFINAYAKVAASINNLFGDKILLPEKEFLNKFAAEFGLFGLDQKIIIQTLLEKQAIFKHKEKKHMFYCIQEPDGEDRLQFDVEKEEIRLNGRIAQINQQLDAIHLNTDLKTKEALECKKRGRKAQAMTLLTELRQLKDTAEKLANERLFIEDIKFKLVHTHGQKELADVLRDVNKILEGNEKIHEEIIRGNDQLRDMEEQNDYLNSLLAKSGADLDLEEMYKDLELEEALDHKVVTHEVISNLSVDEEKKDPSTSDALRKNAEKIKDSSLKEMNNMTDSDVFLKRFTNFEE